MPHPGATCIELVEMIAGIEGKLQSRNAQGAVIKVGGVSFHVQMPSSTLSTLGNIGNTVSLYTSMQVREDSITLYGFATAEELDTFRILLSVTGIGPKVALSVLSAMNPGQLALAISSGNADMLCHIPGVGKKTASRLLLELKDKIAGIAVGTSTPEGNELTAALLGLGYSPSEVTSAIAALPASPELTIEEKIRLALQHFSGR
ncbi:MAG: Holliday junction branch migration protein RuvA [Dehalococcoidia bacterium]